MMRVRGFWGLLRAIHLVEGIDFRITSLSPRLTWFGYSSTRIACKATFHGC